MPTSNSQQPAGTPTTAYQTLVSVNSLDHSKFVDVDRLAVGKYWDKVFTQNNTSEEIFDAIACKGTNADRNKTVRDKASDCLKSNVVTVLFYILCSI